MTNAEDRCRPFFFRLLFRRLRFFHCTKQVIGPDASEKVSGRSREAILGALEGMLGGLGRSWVRVEVRVHVHARVCACVCVGPSRILTGLYKSPPLGRAEGGRRRSKKEEEGRSKKEE